MTLLPSRKRRLKRMRALRWRDQAELERLLAAERHLHAPRKKRAHNDAAGRVVNSGIKVAQGGADVAQQQVVLPIDDRQRVEVRDSGIAGANDGLYALVAIADGDIVCHVGGARVRLEAPRDGQMCVATARGWCIDSSREVPEGMLGPKANDPGRHRKAHARFVAAVSNATHVLVRAVAKIDVGDEILINYGSEYDRTTFNK